MSFVNPNDNPNPPVPSCWSCGEPDGEWIKIHVLGVFKDDDDYVAVLGVGIDRPDRVADQVDISSRIATDFQRDPKQALDAASWRFEDPKDEPVDYSAHAWDVGIVFVGPDYEPTTQEEGEDPPDQEEFPRAA